MGWARLHLVSMYFTESLAVAMLILWFYMQRLEPLLFAVIFTVISATFHVMYMLSKIYEMLERVLKQGCE